MPVLEKMRNVSPGWHLTCWRMTRPKPSTFSRNIAWRRPFGPTTPTWLLIASSAIGWKPGKLPILGNISSVFIREWPEPKTWTRPSAAIVDANSSDAASIGPSWVASSRSSTMRAAPSQRSAAFGSVVEGMGSFGSAADRVIEEARGDASVVRRGGMARGFVVGRVRFGRPALAHAALDQEARAVTAQQPLPDLDDLVRPVAGRPPEEQGRRTARDREQRRLPAGEDHRFERFRCRRDVSTVVLAQDVIERAIREIDAVEP